MVTSYEYALFSDQAYRNPSAGYTLPAGWSVFDSSGSGISLNGYFGIAFTNGTDVVIAHRGTEGLSSAPDLLADLQLALNAIPNQFSEAQAFTDAVKAMMNGSQNLSFTGHSLGGLLAQLSSADEGKHATVFESPGALEVMLDTSLNPNNADVTMYATAPNAINTTNTQIDAVQRLYPDYGVNVTGVNEAEYLLDTLQQHSMAEMLLQFDPTTGQPKIVSEPLVWPNDGYEDYWSKYAWNTYYWDKALEGLSPSVKAAFIDANLGGIGDTSLAGINITGDNSANYIWGATNFRDSLLGGGGADTILGFAGADTIDGESGSDSITSGDGNDVIIASAGNDTVDGGEDSDTLDITSLSGSVVNYTSATSGTVVHGADTISFSNIENVIGATTITGSAANDILTGAGGSEVIFGNGGGDNLSGGGGSDTIHGGFGNNQDYFYSNIYYDRSDYINGGDGNDYLYGGAGFDTISGGAGNDYIEGGSGIYINEEYITVEGGVVIFGDVGSDTIKGTDNDDYIEGGSEADRLLGGRGHDTILGGLGDDTFSANDSDGSYLSAGDGNDILECQSFNNTVYGGDGSDSIHVGNFTNYISGDAGSDTIRLVIYDLGSGATVDGGADADWVWFSHGNSQGPVNVDLGSTSAGVTFLNVENMVGTEFADTLTGDSNNNHIMGEVYLGLSSPGDILSGGDGSDTIEGGAGDALTGGSGNDDFYFRTFGRANQDTITDFASGQDKIDFSYYDDVFGKTIKYIGNGSFSGNFGISEIRWFVSGSDVIVEGNEGSDTAPEFSLRLQNASSISFNDFIGVIDGTPPPPPPPPGVSVIDGTDENDLLYGTPEVDIINANGGSDTVYADEDADTITGGTGNDILYGWTGYDVYNFSGNFGHDTVGDADGSIVIDGVVVAGEASHVGTNLWQLIAGGVTYNLSLNETGLVISADGTTGNDITIDQFAEDLSMLGITLAPTAGTVINDSSGIDSIVGGDGNDALYGGSGGDTIYAGNGSDDVFGGSGADIMDGGIGNDSLDGGTGADTMYGGNGNDFLTGLNGDDYLDGGAGNDYIDCGNGIDIIYAGAGNDTVDAGSGNDVINGGSGVDLLIGGSGADSFEFNTISASGIGTGNRDIISDFIYSQGDKINLSNFAGTFTFIGASSFSGTGMEVRAYNESGHTIIALDADGNATTDMEIELSQSVTLQQTDFVL